MSLIKPPHIATFLLAVILIAVGVLSKFGVAIPVVGGHEFWLLLTANVLFILGCITQGF